MNKIYPKNPRATNGYDNGVIDVAFQLLSCGMVWDGNLSSKSGRDYLVEHGFAVRHDGMQALTGKGVFAMLRHVQTWRRAWNMKRRWKSYGLVASEDQIKRSMR